MKCVTIHGAGDVRLDEVPVPALGPRDVLMKIEACGICGSDLSFARLGFLRAGGAPWPLGHEAAGTIVSVGAEVSGIALGLRAAINPMGAHDNIIGNGGSEGAFADYLLIREAALGRHLLAIPDGMTAERAALVEPLSVALHGVNRAQLGPGDKVVVLGAGPIGLGAVFWLKRRGIESIVAVDLSDGRLAHARRLGASDTINPRHESLQEGLGRIHGPDRPVLGAPTVGTDAFLDMAGGPHVIADIVKVAKFAARIVVTAVYPQPIAIDLQTMLLKEISLFTAVGYPTELLEVLAVLAAIPEAVIAPYVTHRFAFEDFAAAFQAAQDPTSAKVMVSFG